MGKTMDVIAKLLFPEISEKEQETLLAECCRIENDYLREHGGVLYPDLEDTFKELKKTYELYIVSKCKKGYIMMPAEKRALDLSMLHTVLESYRKHSIRYRHFQNL